MPSLDRGAEYQRRKARNPEKLKEQANRASRKARGKRYEIIRQAKDVPCADCRQRFDVVCMDFDHRPGETKLGLVPHMKTWAMEKLLAEIAKCDVVCSNCHRLRTKARKLLG